MGPGHPILGFVLWLNRGQDVFRKGRGVPLDFLVFSSHPDMSVLVDWLCSGLRLLCQFAEDSSVDPEILHGILTGKLLRAKLQMLLLSGHMKSSFFLIAI